MDDQNQYSRAANAACDTIARLQREGHTAAEASLMVSRVINEAVLAVMNKPNSFDEAKFIERLNRLPN